MNTYIKPQNVYIENLSDRFKISKGFLHKQTLVIDKEKSSNAFVDAFETFIRNGTISVKIDSDIDKDFKKLAQFDLIHFEIEEKSKNFIVAERNAIDFLKKYLNINSTVVAPDSILSSDDVNTLVNQKDRELSKSISDRVVKNIGDSNLYVILPYNREKIIQAINILTKIKNMPYTLIFFDNRNLFATNIVHGETGCYECLADSIISKFPKDMEYYRNHYFIKSPEKFDISIYGVIISILNNELKNVNLYGDTALRGNVFHLYLPTYESDFDFNKRQTSCTTCSTVNNILFAEQNMKSCEIMKEVLRKC
ncbi:hypothetical protein [Lactobacillus intestinalis]|uniref:Bacteriocin biosynthesis cyclodehydratase, SagC family n=1 Tax=Lactobacillus intestinalis DSM 6629 TaxID=1423761 RepID=A0ABR5PSU7_9LACO|nr:hypothetical protein [Lactobacillus intestinalis]KRM34677.1 hypothetical protein FC44_GL000996 [Lactobacillus intestinalis DSM 6629]UTW41082.1 bacteriocin biosynthesis cyclodehydratase [Lactobacillus intestinalis]